MRLAIFLTFVVLAASRLGLVAHEFVGHGGMAVLVGGEVTDVKLMWFAGGWIRYQIPDPSTTKFLIVAMGGIAIELVAGTTLVLAARRNRVLRGLGAAFVIHAFWYLAVGAWHGFGDGVLLHRELGGARAPFAIVAGAIVVTAAFFGARTVIGALLATLPRRRILYFAIAAVVAGGINVGLGLTELRLRRDDTYAQVMRPERDRQILADLAKWAAEHPIEAATEQARAAEQRHLEVVHEKPFPFAIVLGIATILALGLGSWRTTIPDHAPVSNRALALAASLAGFGLALTVVLDSLA